MFWKFLMNFFLFFEHCEDKICKIRDLVKTNHPKKCIGDVFASQIAILPTLPDSTSFNTSNNKISKKYPNLKIKTKPIGELHL